MTVAGALGATLGPSKTNSSASAPGGRATAKAFLDTEGFFQYDE